MRTLKTAVVGLGRIAWSDHLPQIAAMPQFELAAIVDPIAERRREAMAQFHCRAAFDAIEPMLEQVCPELTVIASPTFCHARQTIRALRSDSHVFCDKPAGLDAAEVDAMFDCAGECGRKLQIYQPRRLFPEAAAVRQLLAGGKLGRVFRIELAVENFVRRCDWQAVRGNGGGVLLNFGAHYLDLMISLLREEIVAAAAESATILSPGDADDVALIRLRTASGIEVGIDLNQACALPGCRWRIFGDRGTAAGGPDGWRLRCFGEVAPHPARLDRRPAAAGRRYPADEIVWTDEFLPGSASFAEVAELFYRNLYDCLTSDGTPLVPEADSRELMRLLDLCRSRSLHPLCGTVLETTPARSLVS